MLPKKKKGTHVVDYEQLHNDFKFLLPQSNFPIAEIICGIKLNTLCSHRLSGLSHGVSYIEWKKKST